MQADTSAISKAAAWIKERRMALLVAGLAIAMLAPGMFYGLPFGKAITGGLRVLDGDTPYRDFWSMYAPGMFYLQALLFAVFGKTVIPQAIAVILIRAVSGVLFYAIARQLDLARIPAFALAMVIVGMQWQMGPELTSYPPALMLGLLALERITRYVSGASARQPLIQAGLALGVAAWFKHDVAAYFAFGSAAGLIIPFFALSHLPAHWMSPVRAIAILALSAIAAFAPMFLWIAAHAGADAWDNLFIFPLSDFVTLRDEPSPPLIPDFGALWSWLSAPFDLVVARNAAVQFSAWILFYAPVLVFLLGAADLVQRRKNLTPAHFSVGVILLASMPGFWNAANVQMNTHLLSLSVIAFLLGALCWSKAGSGRRGLRALLAIAAVIYASALAVEPGAQAFRMAIGLEKSRVLGAPSTGSIRVSEREYNTYRPILDFLETNTRPGEAIYAGLARHDASVMGNPRFYYLIDRPIVTRYMEMHPGITDALRIQQIMIEEMQASDLRCAIIWHFGWGDGILDEIKQIRMAKVDGLGSTLLDDWFQAEFETVLRRDEYTVVWRRDAETPVLPPTSDR